MDLSIKRIIIFTNGMSAMTQFYRDVLGLRQKSGESGWKEFDAGACDLALHNGSSAVGSRPPKLVFFSRDVEGTREALLKRGAKLGKVNAFHVKQFAYFLEKLRSTPDGDGSLLDHSMLLYGAGISDSNVHLHDNLPLVLAGGADGRVKGGRHLVNPKDTPVTNLFVTMLDNLGVPVESIGDSSGRAHL